MSLVNQLFSCYPAIICWILIKKVSDLLLYELQAIWSHSWLSMSVTWSAFVSFAPKKEKVWYGPGSLAPPTLQDMFSPSLTATVSVCLAGLSHCWKGVPFFFFIQFKYIIETLDVNHFLIVLSLRIAENESTIICPVIDTIDWNTFEFYMQTDEPMVGGFDWRLTFQWHAVPEIDRKIRKSRIDPIRLVCAQLVQIQLCYVVFLAILKNRLEMSKGIVMLTSKLFQSCYLFWGTQKEKPDNITIFHVITVYSYIMFFKCIAPYWIFISTGIIYLNIHAYFLYFYN